MEQTGRLTLPTDADVVEETLRLKALLGADALRDCDGTEMPDALLQDPAKKYATYYTTRKDNAWAEANPDEIQQEYLISDRHTARSTTLRIHLMDGFHTQQLKVNTLDDPKRWWEVIDRTTGEVVPTDKWSFDEAAGEVEIETIPYHEYTVSFLAFLIWDPVHMYNFLTNDWKDTPHQLTYDVRQPKTQAYVKEKLRRWCEANPHIDVVRFTTFFHQFTLTFDDQKREKFVEWFGYGGYLKLASNWPGFIDEIQNVVGEFRQIHENMQGTKSYVAPFKVAILNCWGHQRKWMSNQVHHSIYHRETYSAEGVLECLSGMPFDVEFINFDDVRSGIPKDIGVIINVGDAYTAFSGAENWIDEKVVTAIRKFVDEGGGFIGVGEPTACQHQGRYFQLSDVMGVDREMGFSLSTDKYNTCDPHHFILEDESFTGKIDFGEGTSRIYAQGKHYQILAQDGEYSQLVVNEYGKGHSVYFAGLPYSPQNCRILLRAIYYAAGMPEEMKHYYVTNVDTEVTVFPETKRIAVINNSESEQKTDLYIKGKLIRELTLAPREMRWVDDTE